MSSPVTAALHLQKFQSATAWGKWTLLHGVRALPASPADVARFIRDAAPIAGVDEIGQWLAEIAQCHIEAGYADPTVGGGAPSKAMNALSQFVKPRSWPKTLAECFLSLPYEAQKWIAGQDATQTSVVRRAQNEAADLRHRLKLLEQKQEQNVDTR